MHRGPNILGVGGKRRVHRRITRRTARPGPAGERTESSFIELREARKAKRGEVYRRRRFMAVSLLVLGAVALVFAVFVQTKASDTAERAVPIDPNNAGPATVLAQAVRGRYLHPDPSCEPHRARVPSRGREPRRNGTAGQEPLGQRCPRPPLRGETPEGIHYYVMDAAGRGGPQTGAVDVGARRGQPSTPL